MGRTLGALRGDERLSSEKEHRLEQFAALVAMALASAQARDELGRVAPAHRRRRATPSGGGWSATCTTARSSAGRPVDGAAARHAEAARLDPEQADELLATTAARADREAITDLRELAQGIHPAVLTDRGLGEALEVLAARRRSRSSSTWPAAPLPDAVEVAAYYVVSEALANVVKHSGASSARVRADGTNGCAEIEVADDGAGSADASGSGLRGSETASRRSTAGFSWPAARPRNDSSAPSCRCERRACDGIHCAP